MIRRRKYDYVLIEYNPDANYVRLLPARLVGTNVLEAIDRKDGTLILAGIAKGEPVRLVLKGKQYPAYFAGTVASLEHIRIAGQLTPEKLYPFAMYLAELNGSNPPVDLRNAKELLEYIFKQMVNRSEEGTKVRIGDVEIAKAVPASKAMSCALSAVATLAKSMSMSYIQVAILSDRLVKLIQARARAGYLMAMRWLLPLLAIGVLGMIFLALFMAFAGGLQLPTFPLLPR